MRHKKNQRAGLFFIKMKDLEIIEDGCVKKIQEILQRPFLQYQYQWKRWINEGHKNVFYGPTYF